MSLTIYPGPVPELPVTTGTQVTTEKQASVAKSPKLLPFLGPEIAGRLGAWLI